MHGHHFTQNQPAWYQCLVGTLQLDDLPLLDLPMENAALAVQAFALLALPWNADVIAAALCGTRVTGRLDRREITWRGKRLQLMLDVGHNPHAASYLDRKSVV